MRPFHVSATASVPSPARATPEGSRNSRGAVPSEPMLSRQCPAPVYRRMRWLAVSATTNHPAGETASPRGSRRDAGCADKSCQQISNVCTLVVVSVRVERRWIQNLPCTGKDSGITQAGHLIHALTQSVGSLPGVRLSIDDLDDVTLKDKILVLLITEDPPVAVIYPFTFRDLITISQR